jgi:hypothetical protein
MVQKSKGGLSNGELLMNRRIGSDSEQFYIELQDIAPAIRALAQNFQGDSLALVSLLRHLEEIHREIREGLFQASLPDNRQALYKLLKDIETEGGWPYIERMKLQALLANLPTETIDETSNDRQEIKDTLPLKANPSITVNEESESDLKSQ